MALDQEFPPQAGAGELRRQQQGLVALPLPSRREDADQGANERRSGVPRMRGQGRRSRSKPRILLARARASVAPDLQRERAAGGRGSQYEETVLVGLSP